MSVIGGLRKRFGPEVSLILGPAEAERGWPDIARHEGVAYRTCDKVADAAKCIAKSRLYVGNDSGITHVSAALGVPTVAIFTSTDPVVWRPLGERVEIVDVRTSEGRRECCGKVLEAARRARARGGIRLPDGLLRSGSDGAGRGGPERGT